MTDLPQYATPWTGEAGKWCLTSQPHSDYAHLWWYDLDIGYWRENDAVRKMLLSGQRLAGLGREVPPMLKPKTVATAVPLEGYLEVEYAALLQYPNDKELFCRVDKQVWRSTVVRSEREVLAAARAFALAGELLPDEEESDA